MEIQRVDGWAVRKEAGMTPGAGIAQVDAGLGLG